MAIPSNELHGVVGGMLKPASSAKGEKQGIGDTKGGCKDFSLACFFH